MYKMMIYNNNYRNCPSVRWGGVIQGIFDMTITTDTQNPCMTSLSEPSDPSGIYLNANPYIHKFHNTPI